MGKLGGIRDSRQRHPAKVENYFEGKHVIYAKAA
jgi:hypothetical protein